MLTISDFVSRYEGYSDDELYDIYQNKANYSEDAQKALEIVIDKRGGMSSFLELFDKKKTILNEIYRIRNEASMMAGKGLDADFIKSTLTSSIISSDKVNEIIENVTTDVQLQKEDEKIKPRTIAGSLVGVLVATIVGGILWSLQLIYSNRIFIIFGIGLALLCYGIIKAITKQSKSNVVVLIASILSVCLAILLGQIIFGIVGYKG